jgi:hypothetical protein
MTTWLTIRQRKIQYLTALMMARKIAKHAAFS